MSNDFKLFLLYFYFMRKKGRIRLANESHIKCFSVGVMKFATLIELDV